jgi:hypothetical protein
METASVDADRRREAMRGYPHVRRGLGLAVALMAPSCSVATCGHACTPNVFYHRDPVLVDRKIAPDGTVLSVTAETMSSETELAKRIWFHVERRGGGSQQLLLGKEAFLSWSAEIQLRAQGMAAVVDEFSEEVLVDWRNGEVLSPPLAFGARRTDDGDPGLLAEQPHGPR